MNGTWELVYSLLTRLTHCCYICEMYTVRSFTPLFTGNTISLLSGEVIKTINTTTLITFLYYFFPLMTAWQNKRRFLWNPELYLNIYLPPLLFHFSPGMSRQFYDRKNMHWEFKPIRFLLCNCEKNGNNVLPQTLTWSLSWLYINHCWLSVLL